MLGIPVQVTYGYQTKRGRISQRLEKTHVNDAFVIAGGEGQERRKEIFHFRQVRKQNRKLYKGVRSHIRSKADRVLFGFRQWDRVRYKGQEYYIKGRRLSGYFSLSDIFGQTALLAGKKLDSIRYSKLELVEKASTLLSGGVVSSPA